MHVAAALELDEISLLKTVPPFAIDARERHLELDCLLGFKGEFRQWKHLLRLSVAATRSLSKCVKPHKQLLVEPSQRGKRG